MSDRAPSIRNGATIGEIESYAYRLLKKDNGTNAIGYNEATAYYNSQIEAASDKEQKFNLQLDFATFYGKTGDPAAGIQILEDINNYNIPLDARYYLYATYIYLYDCLHEESLANDYYRKIEEEGINEYFENIDNGSITPGLDKDIDDADENTQNDDCTDGCLTDNAEFFNEKAL